jgi:zinc transporter ZupT
MVIWAMVLITIIVLATFDDLSLVTASVAAALSSVVGILSVVIGFYIQSRKLDDERKKDA